jgi:hypothetical protein
MPLSLRLVLAAVSGLFGVTMVLIAPGMEKPVFIYIFGGFCIAIALACLVRGRLAQFFGSLVAAGVLIVGIWYSISTLLGGELISGSRSQPSFLNSIFFLAVFCVPAAMYLWSARFGFAKITEHKKDPKAGNEP